MPARPLIALDATYGAGRALTGVGVYSRRLLDGLASLHPEADWLHCYRSQRFVDALRLPRTRHVSRRLLWGPLIPRRADLFHGLNQRLPEGRLKCAITTFHDLFVLTGNYSTPEFRERFAKQARDAASRSDLIVTVSRFTAGQVESLLGIPNSRLRPIPHGVDLPPKSEILPLAARPKRILFVGALQQRKNIERLITAFESLDDEWRITLAGSAGYGAAQIAERIERSPARGRIHLPGYVTARQLDALYREARIFAFPSLDEGFGIPVLEAMAWGIPVLTSDRSGLPEAAGDAAVLVNPLDTDEIAHGLQQLACDETKADACRLKGLARASMCTWESAIEKTWIAYRELL